MLLDLRDGIRNSKWLKYLLVGIICVPFALFGVNSYFSGHGPDYAAKVNGEKISLNTFQSAYQQQRAQIAQMFGGRIPENFDSASMINNQAMDSIVTREIIRQSTAENQLAVSDEALADNLINIEGFAVDGRFDKERYQLQLQSMGVSPAEFEDQFRGDLIMQQYSESVINSGFALAKENSKLEKLRNQKRNLATISFNLQEKADSIEISDNEASTFYDENVARYNNPEKVTVEYIELKLSDLKASVEVTDADLNGYFTQNKSRWVAPEERDASHILLALDSDASDSDANEKLELANSLIQRVNDGESFEDLAKEFSDDPGSGDQGGSLGQFGPGVMVPPFEEAAFALQKGELSEPVRSDFGYHIIRLNEIIGERGQGFEEVKAEVEDQFRTDAADTEYFGVIDLLSNASYESSESLQPASDETGLEIQTSDWIDANTTEGIGQYRQVIAAALTDEVLNQGLNSEVLEVGENHAIVLRVLDHEEAQPKPLDEVKEDVVAALQRQTARTQLTELADKLRDELAAGGDAAAIAEANGAVFQEVKAVGRNDAAEDRAVSTALFAMSKPAEGQSTYRTVTTAVGDIALAIFSGITAPAEDEESVAASATAAPASSEFTAMVSSLESSAKIERNEAVLGGGPSGYGM